MLYQQLSEFLESQVNRKISRKMKQGFESDAKGYFKLREQIEARLVQETNWLSYFLEKVTTDTLIEDLKNLENSDLLTFNQIIVETLKRFIDAFQEENSFCIFVLGIYRDTKAELLNRFENYPKSDGFADYLEVRGLREEKANARVTGEMCVYCFSKSVRSNGDKWKCDSCGKRFRKA